MLQRMIVDEALLDRARDHAVRFLRDIAERHVGATATREQLLTALRVPLSDGGEEAASVIDALVHGASGGLIGHTPTFIGCLND